MPKAIHELNSYGIVVTGFMVELSIIVSYEEIAVWYGSFVVTYALTVNDLVSAMR